MKNRNKNDEESMQHVDDKNDEKWSNIDEESAKIRWKFNQKESKTNQTRPSIDLGGFWAPKCVFGRILGGSWSGFEASWRLRWAILRRPGASWRRLGGILGPSWRILEASKMSQHSEMMPQNTNKYRTPYKTNVFFDIFWNVVEATWRQDGLFWGVLEGT